MVDHGGRQASSGARDRWAFIRSHVFSGPMSPPIQCLRRHPAFQGRCRNAHGRDAASQFSIRHGNDGTHEICRSQGDVRQGPEARRDGQSRPARGSCMNMRCRASAGRRHAKEIRRLEPLAGFPNRAGSNDRRSEFHAARRGRDYSNSLISYFASAAPGWRGQ